MIKFATVILSLLSVINGYVSVYNSIQTVELINEANTTWQADYEFVENVGLNNLRNTLGEYDDWNNNDGGDFDSLEFVPTIPRPGYEIGKPVELPDSFDARKEWPKCSSISHIRIQGNCKNCWAVSSTSAFSDRLCVASGQRLNIRISAQQVTFCCKECGHGCTRGGDSRSAWRFFKEHGAVTGGDYNSEQGCQPYEIPPSKSQDKAYNSTCLRNRCSNSKYKISYKDDLHYVRSVYTLPATEEIIRRDILLNGPVSSSIDVYGDFYYYKKGIYQRQPQFNLHGRHAIKIIGWGAEKKVKYWICSNTWGKKWGEEGTFKILKGNNECGIEGRVVTGLPKI